MTVTLEGLDGVRNQLAGVFQHLGVGYGTTTPAETDTDLEDEVVRVAQSSSDTSVPKKFTSEFVVNSGQANGVALGEVGMFDGDVTTISDCESTTNWAVGGGATNLSTDTSVYKTPLASLTFDMDGSTATGTVTYSSPSTVDTHNDSFLYSWVFVADTTNLTEVNVYASSAGVGTDYYKWTYAVANLTNNDWNLLKADWSSPDATSGSTDLTNINYIEIEVVQSTATSSTTWRIDDIRSVDQVMFNREEVPAIEKTNLKEIQYEITVTIDNK